MIRASLRRRSTARPKILPFDPREAVALEKTRLARKIRLRERELQRLRNRERAL